MLIEVDSETGVMTMLDGTKWEVNPYNLPEAVIWIPTAEIEITKKYHGAMYDHEIRNIENDDVIRARKIS